jgi:hypothetical protein
MNEQYFDHKYMGYFRPTLWWRIKMAFFGKKIVERSGPITTVWYAHNGKLYLVNYRGGYDCK